MKKWKSLKKPQCIYSEEYEHERKSFAKKQNIDFREKEIEKNIKYFLQNDR